MEKAVVEMGTAVIHGGTSTFIAVLILAFSKSYIFRTIFKQFFGICIFGMAHGLILLPVMLSLIGPKPLDTKATAGVTPKEAANYSSTAPSSTTTSAVTKANVELNDVSAIPDCKTSTPATS